MKVFSAVYLRELGISMLGACGASPEEAAIVADELVEASLMGVDSHGVMRYVQYVEQVLEGKIKPGAPIRIIKETPSTAVVDCGLNFGMVSANRMVDIVCEKAKRSHIACAVSRNSNHVGRLGSYAHQVATRGFFCLATVNSSKHGHFVVPWGGREGRLATNPLAYGAPTSGEPVVLDMSTAMIAEGKIRVLMQQGEPVPPGCIQDASGNPTTDPHDFYGPPRGNILPFGSHLGYRGFGLSLLVEILGGILAGEATQQDSAYINGLCLIAIDPEEFCGLEYFRRLMDEMSAYITSSPPAPGFAEVVMPGTLDYRTRDKRAIEGIPVANETWRQIVETARQVGVLLDEGDG